MKKVASAAALVLLAGTAGAQVIGGYDNSAVPMQVLDSGSRAFVGTIDQGARGVRALASNDNNRTFYYSTGSQLWTIPYDAPQTPVLVGTFNGAVSAISGGLAWDSTRSKLYATTTSSIYEVDPNTATTTLLRAIGGGDFGGLDYDPATDQLYGANDSTSTAGGLQGRGVYTLTFPIETGTFTKIADYPTRASGSAETDIDGLAVGGGRVWLITDQEEAIYVLNPGVGYETPILQTGVGADRTFSGGTWAPGYLQVTNFDVNVAVVSPANCSLAVGENATYTVTVSNPGNQPVSGASVSITLPGNTTFVSSSPAGTLAGNVLTVNLGGINGQSSSSADVTVTLDAGVTFQLDATVAINETDPNTANNTASGSFDARPALPTEASISAILSTVSTSDTSLVPGIPGARFAAGTPGRPWFSPNGQMMVMEMDTDLPTSQDGMIVMWNASTGFTVVAQENTFPELPTTPGPSGSTPPFFPFSTIDDRLAINDAGQYVFSGVDSRSGTTDDGYIVKWNGTAFELIAQEGVTQFPVAGVDVLLGSTRGSVNISQSGLVGFRAGLTGSGVTTGTDTAIFADNGATLLGQEGVTGPSGAQDGFGIPISVPFKLFDTGTVNLGFSMSSDHQNWVASGTIDASTSNPPTSGVDEVAVRSTEAGSEVVIQENVVLAGTTFVSTADNITPYDYLHMEHNGDWFAYGDNNDDQDWVLKNGQVIAKTGDEIFAGAGEFYSDVPFATTYFFAAGNSNGDYVIGGTTDGPNDLANAVIVLNGERVLVRENDPVDLNGDGTFDEDVFVRTFLDDRGALTNEAFYIWVRLRDGAGATGCGSDSDIGQALLRIPLSTGPSCPVCAADFDQSGGVDGDDIGAFFADWQAGAPCGDVDGSGGVDGDDIGFFFARWEAGGCD